MIDSRDAEPGANDLREGQEADEALEASLSNCAGNWVAVNHREVIDNDGNLGDLVGRLNGQRASAEIFKVETAPDPSCTP
jgi:hypothetical protein